MKKKNIILLVVGAVLVGILIGFMPTIVGVVNNYVAKVKKVDDATNYETLKKVEDTCRAMIATYEKCKIEYEANNKKYEETQDTYYREVADGYRQQANTTAATYNEYILKNTYVWKNDVPDDIYMTLEYLQ